MTSNVKLLAFFQDGASPDMLLSKNAFRRVIFGKGGDGEGKELAVAESPSPFSSGTFDAKGT